MSKLVSRQWKLRKAVEPVNVDSMYGIHHKTVTEIKAKNYFLVADIAEFVKEF